MRVIAGLAKGRLLRAPAGSRTRPTADRVREAMFASLASITPLARTDAVDLFAGSGALGVEALSRGAASVTFVERDPRAVAVIRANLEVLAHDATRATVVRADARSWTPDARAGVDVVFADPPYAFDGWAPLLARWASLARLAVLETGDELDLGSGWEILRRKRYGGTVVTVAQSVQKLSRSASCPGPA